MPVALLGSTRTPLGASARTTLRLVRPVYLWLPRGVALGGTITVPGPDSEVAVQQNSGVVREAGR